MKKKRQHEKEGIFLKEIFEKAKFKINGIIKRLNILLLCSTVNIIE